MYRKISDSWLKHWDFELVDIICIEFAFLMAYYLRHGVLLFDSDNGYGRSLVILFLVQCLLVFFEQGYKGILYRGYIVELWMIIKHVSLVEIWFVVCEFFMKDTMFLSRYVVLVGWVLGVALCYLARIVLKLIVKSVITDEQNQSKMLLITNKENLNEVLERLLGQEVREYNVTSVAILTGEKITNPIFENIEYIYGEDGLWEYVRQNIVDEVYIDVFQDKDELDRLIETFLTMGITAHIGLGFLPEGLPNRFIGKIGRTQTVTTSIKAATAWKIALKRLMDIAGGTVGIILTGIAYVIVAPIIKKQSPGPVFFKQERVGRNGRMFYIYKFRSMYMDAEERKKALMEHNQMQGLMFKMENDPRIIGSEKGPGKGIGNFIRKTSIDELPQFWNVLKGDMSLVGTRPPTKEEYGQYQLHHKIRLSMKPGITGMWQTSGRSEITDFEEIVKMDAEYIENWSLLLDVKLILKTVKVVLFREGAK